MTPGGTSSVLVGPPILCAVVLAAAVDKARFDNYPHVRLLYWDGTDRGL